MPPTTQTPPRRKVTAQTLRAVLPDVWELVRPRRGLLAISFFLMVINRVAGLVLPYSTKFLIDTVIGKHHVELLKSLVLFVLLATATQGVTSFALTQLLSKAGQRLIADLRRKVQAHIGRLPVAFYDTNKTGTLVSRIMSDVEGRAQSLGHRAGGFCGWADYFRHCSGRALSHQPGDDIGGIHFPAVLRSGAEQSLWDYSSHFSRARQDQCRGYRAPDGIAQRRAGD